MVTLIYLLEQLSIFVLGSTSRATDSRILLSFVLDSGFAFLFGMFAKDQKVIWILPYFASRNLILGAGLKKPFSIVNEELEKQREQADIVFSSLNKSVEVVSDSTMKTYVHMIKFVLETVLILATIFGTLFMREDELENSQVWSSETEMDIMTFQMILGAGIISGVIYILSALSNGKKYRMVPCPSVRMVSIVIQILLILLKVLLTGTFVMNAVYFLSDSQSSRYSELMVLLIAFGRIRRA